MFWTAQGMIELDTLLPGGSGWTLRAAADINNLGQIVGRGISPAGVEHAFLLSPVPEPAATLLLAAVCLHRMSRRRR